MTAPPLRGKRETTLSALAEQIEYVSTQGIPMRRVWAMPSANTFSIPPIRSLVKSYLLKSKVSVDPFARNKRWATYTNDLNPETAAEYHMDVLDFLKMLQEKNVQADLVIFDPPYSSRQIKECYEGIGLKMPYERTLGWGIEKRLLRNLLTPSGIALSFGWDSTGLAMSEMEIVEILLVNHGKSHHDTICTVERKIESAQVSMFTN
jgi:hypothetical protein